MSQILFRAQLFSRRGECKLYNVGDREAAMLMAIVANKLGKPLNTLRFKSMKEVI